MKLIHTADLHLDSKMESNLDAGQARERRLELLDTFGRMADYAAAEGVAAILLAGDLFDKIHIRKSAKRRVLEEIRTHPQVDFLYLRGNHDNSDFLADVLEKGKPKNLKTFQGSSWTSYEYNDVVVTGRELSDENYKSASVNLILDESKLNIVMLHGQESDYVDRNRANILQLGEFKNKFIDYLALGHVHSYRTERLDDRGIYCYPGCLEGRSFEECGSKGFVLLTIDEESKKLNHKFIPFAKRRFCEISVEVTESMDMQEILSAVRRALRDVDRRDLVRVVLFGVRAIDFDVDCVEIDRIFQNEFYFFKIIDRTRIRVHYESFATDRSLKGEFVSLLQNESIPEDERSAIIDLGMKALLGEDLQ